MRLMPGASIASAVVLTAIGLLATSCLGPGTTQSPRLFVLSATAPATEGGADGLGVGVGPVHLPERYNRPQILTRTGDNEVEIAEFSRWAEPLEENFSQVLAENLSRLVPTDSVSVYPWAHHANIHVQVEVEVTRFESREGGAVELAARWRLISSKGDEVTPLQHSQYSALPASSQMAARVAAMSTALGEFSRDVAAALARTER